MSVAQQIYIFPRKNRILLNFNEGVINEALEKAQIYSKALSDSLIQIISSQSKPLSSNKLANMLYLSIVFAKKVHYFAAVAQKKFGLAIHLLRLFAGIIHTLEELANGDLSAEGIANCLYGIFELLNEVNSTILAE